MPEQKAKRVGSAPEQKKTKENLTPIPYQLIIDSGYAQTGADGFRQVLTENIISVRRAVISLRVFSIRVLFED